MRKTFAVILLFSFLGCYQSDSNSSNPSFDTSTRDIFKKVDSLIPKKSEEISLIKRKADTTLLLKISEEILKAIKKRDYNKFASFIHPEYGVRFSPYAYIDTLDHQVLSSKEVIQIAKQKKSIDWNTSWEIEPEYLTIDQYFTKFVYDVDFLNAELKSINEYHSQGTDLNNIEDIYTDCDIVEFFFSGFEKKYNGHDFRGLRFVYKYYNNKLFLIGVVHDEWTP